jgi:RNA polymerase sigma-70 factor, ECF subfamily
VLTMRQDALFCGHHPVQPGPWSEDGGTMERNGSPRGSSGSADEQGGAKAASEQDDLAPAAQPLTAAQERDFAVLFRTYAGFVFRVLLRLGVAQSDVDDVTQEVFLGVHRNLARFEGRCSVRTWIYGICHRRAVDYRRRARVRPGLASDPDVELPGSLNQEQDYFATEAKLSLDRALSTLDDDKRAVFVLFEIEGIPMDEVAEIVGCPLQTAYSRLYAARKKVESALKRERSPRPQRGDAP